MSDVSFGKFENIAGKMVATGMGNLGVNSDELIKALTAAKDVQINKINDNISLTNKKIEAYSQFQTLLSNLQTAADALRYNNQVPGSGTQSDVFQARAVNLASTGTVPASSFVKVTTTNGVPINSYSIQNISLGASETRYATFSGFSSSASVVASSSTANMFTAGTLVINNTLLGQSANISLTAGMSLFNVAAAINAASSTTNVTATVFEIDPTTPVYRLNIQSNTPGTTITVTNPATSNVTWTDVAASSTSVKIGGVTITRNSNSISDFIAGMTFNLLQNNSSDIITCSVAEDQNQALSAIDNFINAYNAVANFYAKMTERDPVTQTYADTAYLHDETTLSMIMNSINGDILSSISGLPTGDTYTSLAAIGISLTQEQGEAISLLHYNNLSTITLQNAINSNFNYVRKVFVTDFIPDNSNFFLNSRDKAIGTNSFSLTVKPNLLTSLSSQTVITSKVASIVATTPTSNMFTAGSFSINGNTITLTNGDSLQTIANNINAIGGINVTASIQDIPGGYQFVIAPSNGQTSFDLQDPSQIFANNLTSNIIFIKAAAAGAAQISYSTYTNVNLNFQPYQYGGLITGISGGILDGWGIAYMGGDHATTNATVSQGIADKLYIDLDNFLDSIDGAITTQVSNLNDKKANYSAEATKLQNDIQTEQTNLLKKIGYSDNAQIKSKNIINFLVTQQDYATKRR